MNVEDVLIGTRGLDGSGACKVLWVDRRNGICRQERIVSKHIHVCPAQAGYSTASVVSLYKHASGTGMLLPCLY